MLARFTAPLARGCMFVAVAGLSGIVAVVAIQVFGRYVVNGPPVGAGAPALVLFLSVTRRGGGVGVRAAGHIGMESLLVLVPERVRNRLEILIYALVGTFGAIMAWNGAILGASVAPYKIPTLGISEAFSQAPLVISGALIVLFSIEHVIALMRGEEVKPA